MSKLDGYVITASGAYLSDLFFNFEHPAFDRLSHERHEADESFTAEEAMTALREDAQGMIMCTDANRESVDYKADLATAFAEDFLRRL